MILGCVLYGIAALLSWGFFMSIPNKTPVTNFIMAAIWPVAWLLILGYAIGHQPK